MIERERERGGRETDRDRQTDRVREVENRNWNCRY